MRCLPQGVVSGVGLFLGWLWYYLLPVRRRVARDNLRLAFPNASAKQRRRWLRASLVHWSRCALEFVRIPSLDRKKAERLVEHVGLEHLDQALKSGRGVIVATAHFGSFDLMACIEALRGVPLHVVTRSQHVHSVNRYWMGVRRRSGVGLIPDKNVIFAMHRVLRQGQVLVLVIDQHMPRGRGISVPFFGRNASTIHAPAVLALLSKATILPVTIERLKGSRHRVIIEPPVPVDPNAQRLPEVVRITTALNQWLENRIRSRPDHWLWIHRRWKLPLVEPTSQNKLP